MSRPIVRRPAGKTAAPAKTAAKPAPKAAPVQEEEEEETENLPAESQSSEVTVAKNLSERFASAAGKGATETMGAKDYAIPFIKILDKSSQETIEGSDKYIEGARPGMIFNTVTKEIFDGKEGIVVVPCGFKSVVLEWESTEPGSGFIAEHPASSDIKIKSAAQLKETAGGGKRLVIPSNGHCLQDANNYFVMMVKEDGDITHAIISMTGSNLTQARLWNSMMSDRKMVINNQRMKAPTYGVQYQMTSAAKTDGKFHWHVWNIVDAGLIDDEELFDRAESFYETVNEGLVKGNYQSTAQEAPVADPAGGDSNQDHIDDDDKLPY